MAKRKDRKDLTSLLANKTKCLKNKKTKKQPITSKTLKFKTKSNLIYSYSKKDVWKRSRGGLNSNCSTSKCQNIRVHSYRHLYALKVGQKYQSILYYVSYTLELIQYDPQ